MNLQVIASIRERPAPHLMHPWPEPWPETARRQRASRSDPRALRADRLWPAGTGISEPPAAASLITHNRSISAAATGLKTIPKDAP
jgi:hypothetical protein